MTQKKTKNDSFIIPINKSKVIKLDGNNILSRLGELRRNQKEQKEISSAAHGQLIQISKEINEILEELSLR